jgi:hypothetical protein
MRSTLACVAVAIVASIGPVATAHAETKPMAVKSASPAEAAVIAPTYQIPSQISELHPASQRQGLRTAGEVVDGVSLLPPPESRQGGFG